MFTTAGLTRAEMASTCGPAGSVADSLPDWPELPGSVGSVATVRDDADPPVSAELHPNHPPSPPLPTMSVAIVSVPKRRRRRDTGPAFMAPLSDAEPVSRLCDAWLKASIAPPCERRAVESVFTVRRGAQLDRLDDHRRPVRSRTAHRRESWGR